LSLPHPLHTFDFAISIAVIHHLSTPARRVEAVQVLLDVLKPEGRALIFVWALEQKDSRRGWDAGQDQDVMVPWVMKVAKPRPAKAKKKNKIVMPSATAGEITTADGKDIDLDSAPKTSPAEIPKKETAPSGDRTFNRYYHLYKSGELESDIQAAGGVVEDSGYEKDNWWAILRRRSM
jgi:tRNA (uracil-5-)-methyltransferase TRM9